MPSECHNSMNYDVNFSRKDTTVVMVHNYLVEFLCFVSTSLSLMIVLLNVCICLHCGISFFPFS